MKRTLVADLETRVELEVIWRLRIQRCILEKEHIVVFLFRYLDKNSSFSLFRLRNLCNLGEKKFPKNFV